MKKIAHSVCVLCGNPRVVVRVWKEVIDDSVITNTETACSNAECQKKVDQENKKQKDRYLAMKLKSQERMFRRRNGEGSKTASH